MAAFPGTQSALSGLISGVVQGQSPHGQEARMRRIDMEDQLAQTQALRTALEDHDWDQPNASEHAFKKLAAIDPNFNMPLLNLVGARQQQAKIDAKRKQFAEEYRTFAPGGISDEELARAQATRAELGLEDVRDRDPLRMYPYEMQYRGRLASRAQGTDPLLKHAIDLMGLGYPEDKVNKLIADARSTGKFDYESLGRPTLRQPAEAKDRMEVMLLNHPEIKELANSLGYGTIVKQTRFHIDDLKKDTLAPDVEAMLSLLAAGTYNDQLSPETREVVDRYRAMLSLGTTTDKADAKTTKTKRVPGFGGK